MDKLKDALLKTLTNIEGSGSFEAAGIKNYSHPGLQVQGIGEIGLPLSAAQTKELIAQAHKAPFGKGSQTITDTSVRSAWEVDAGKISFQNSEWATLLDNIMEEVKEGLGIGDASVKANLYKLLLYETGDFFLTHKDSEKEKGMFGTLIVGLPSTHTGGELFIRFDSREKIVDFSEATRQYKIPYVAFFADCDHEIKPVTSGQRLALVYNLVQSGKGTKVQSPRLGEQAEALGAILAGLEPTETSFPKAVLLGHQYTPANFSRDALKLHDRPRAEALLTAAEKAGYFACLGLVTHYQAGELEYEYRGRSRRSSWYGDDDDLSNGTMGEVYESSTTVKHWLMEDTPGLGELDFEPADIWSKHELGAGEDPIEKDAEGYTGNAGMTMSYWYHYGAVIFWPKSQHTEVLSGASTDIQLNWIDYYCRHWDDLAPESANMSRKLGIQLLEAKAAHIREHHRSDYSPIANMLLRANDEVLVGQLAPLLSAAFHEINIASWEDLLQHFRPQLFESVFQAVADQKKIGITNHLLKVLTRLDSLHTPVIRSFLQGQIERLPGYLDKIELSNFIKERTLWQPEYCNREHLAASTSVVEQTLALSLHLDENDAWVTEALFVLANPLPRHYVNKVLTPILLKSGANLGFLGTVIHRLCVEDLTARVNNKPTPPPDWHRKMPKIEHYQAFWDVLRHFIGSPTERVFDYRKAQAERSSMESAIQSVEIDLKMETIRTGSPHTLRITKTQDAYEKTMKEWHEDEVLLEQLSQMSI